MKTVLFQTLGHRDFQLKNKGENAISGWSEKYYAKNDERNPSSNYIISGGGRNSLFREHSKVILDLIKAEKYEAKEDVLFPILEANMEYFKNNKIKLDHIVLNATNQPNLNAAKTDTIFEAEIIKDLFYLRWNKMGMGSPPTIKIELLDTSPVDTAKLLKYYDGLFDGIYKDFDNVYYCSTAGAPAMSFATNFVNLFRSGSLLEVRRDDVCGRLVDTEELRRIYYQIVTKNNYGN